MLLKPCRDRPVSPYVAKIVMIQRLVALLGEIRAKRPSYHAKSMATKTASRAKERSPALQHRDSCGFSRVERGSMASATGGFNVAKRLNGVSSGFRGRAWRLHCDVATITPMTERAAEAIHGVVCEVLT